jgi:hypothetical protein
VSLLKWILIVFGVLFIVIAAALFGLGYWASGVESVKMTAADLEVGGSYPPEEKQALVAACEKSRGADSSTQCACIADRAGTEFSRFERLIFTASLEHSATKIVAVTKGLIESGVSPDRAQELERNASQRFDGLMQACGLKQ